MALILFSHPLSSYHQKAAVGVYELGIEAEFMVLSPDAGEAMARFQALSPLGKFPLLVDEARDMVVRESSVIIEYLDLAYPSDSPLVPRDPAAALEVRYLDRVFDNYVQTPMQRIVADRIRPPESRDPYGVEQSRAELRKTYAMLEAQFADGRTWAAGETFSLADCGAGPALYYAGRVEPFAETYPALGSYQGRLQARPSYARAFAESEPFLHMFPQD